MTMLLAADIGGTNSRFAAFELGPAGPELKEKTWLRTVDAGSMAELLDALANSGFGLKPDHAGLAVFAVAGPVEGGRRCDPPNIDWDIDADQVEQAAGLARLLLINDFVAQAFACASPIFAEAATILTGQPQYGATLAVIGAGTGLGKCALVPDGRGRNIAVPSEGGHTVFPFVTDREHEYLNFARQHFGRQHIIGDLVVSGPGLSALHAFLSGETLQPHEVAAALPDHPETLQWFARFYARACRNYALEVMALAGVCIAGGVAAKNPDMVTHPEFSAEFHASETHARLLENMPLYLNRNEDAGLWGAAAFGRQHG